MKAEPLDVAEDRNGMVVLAPEECFRRLGRCGVGRVAVTLGALPAIFPVNYAVDKGDVYFRTGAGTKLAAATNNAVVAFEIDSVDPIFHQGWSVMVVGEAEVVDDDAELAELEHLPLTRWLRSGPSSLVRLRGTLVSGRQLGFG